MRKRILVIATALMCTVSLCACGKSNDTDEETTEKIAIAESNSKEYENLQKKYDELSDDYNELQQKYDELKAEYDEIVNQPKEEPIEEVVENATEETITTEEPPADWSEYASDITYEQLARTPDDYKGKAIQLTGEVIQLLEGADGTNAIRIALDTNWDEVVYAEYDSTILDERVLENDRVTVYGYYYGIYQYESTLGQMVSVPSLYAENIEIKK